MKKCKCTEKRLVVALWMTESVTVITVMAVDFPL